MSQDTAQIRKVQDKEGTQFFPITHVDAVIDENGDAVSTLLAGKQATLVSGTNIKTINSQSLLGSGNIVIEGGGGGGSIDSIVMNGDAVTVTGGVADLGTVITQHQDISGKADKVSSSTNGNFAGLDANGNLTDSGHKHSDYQAALVSGTNIKTVNSTSLLGSGNVSVGTYSKPSGGIPKTDLASDVQTSLGLADTALQSYTETDPTVPSWAKASSKPSYTFSEIGTTPTTISGYGITDAKIANGTITLGNNTITPLTSFTETDPVFSAAAAASIQSTDISAWNAKLSGVTFNGVSATVTGGVAAITATIPAAPGTLQTDLTTAQTASASEALSGSIKLHKIAKTGTYSDLIGTPTIPTKVSELTNDAGYTTNTGTVTRVDVGTNQYSPTSGIVSLPAYPTTLPASDVSAWAKAANKPSYTLDEVSDGSTRSLANYLPLSGGTLQNDEFPLILKRSSSSASWLKFENTGGVLGSIGMDTDSHLIIRNAAWTANYDVYHSGNSNLSTVNWTCNRLVGNVLSATRESDGEPNFYIYNDSGTNGFNLSAAGSDSYIGFLTNTTGGATERARITSTGNFGLGTTTPQGILNTAGGEVWMQNTGGANLYLTGTARNANNGAIIFADTYSSIGMRNGFKIASEYANTQSRQNLVFYSSNNTTSPYTPSWDAALKIQYDAKLLIKEMSSATVMPGITSSYTTPGLFAFRNGVPHILGPAGGNSLVIGHNAFEGIKWAVFKLNYVSSNTSNLALGAGNSNITNFTFAVTGNITATGTITPGSDSRIKNNQKDITKECAFSVLENLKPKTWTWNKDIGYNKEGAGLVAQEVKEVLPSAVVVSKTEEFEDFHSLNYNTIQGYEIAAIKGLIEEVKSLKAELAELKKQIK